MPPFAEYLEYMFDHKTGSPVGLFKTEDKVTMWDLMRCDIMFPVCKDIVQLAEMTADMGVHFGVVIRHEFRDTGKATAKYVSVIKGAKSLNKLSRAERNASLSLSKSNSVSESLHIASTDVLITFRTISIPNATGLGQSRTNNEHGRGHTNFVLDQKPKTPSESRTGAYVNGSATNLDPLLRRSLTKASKERAEQHTIEMKGWMEFQFETR